jgi:hypothetical protein
MNYFERLIRRALLQPAKQPGATLADPFENVAEWALDPPTRRAPVAPTPLPSRVERHHHETATTNRVLEKPERPSTIAIDPPVPPPPASREESTQPPSVVRHEIVREITSATVTPPPASKEANAADEGIPLEIADRFMRGLGLKVPSSPSPVGNRITPHMEARASPLPPGEETSAAPAQVVAPPVEMHRQLPASRSASTGESSQPPPAAAERRTEEPARRNGPAIETREVIVIERRGSRTGDDLIPGGGSPRFGLGQL